MAILTMFQPQLEEDFLNKLHQVALTLKKLKNPNYAILRSQYSIAAMSFEHNLFSRKNVFFNDPAPQLDARSHFVPAQFSSQSTYCGQEMKIRLPDTFQIQEILFAVDQNQEDKFKFNQKMRIQIYLLDHNEKKLVHDESLNSATWYQLSQYAYVPAKYEGYFDRSQNLECVGTGCISLKARYLVVQFCHFL